MTTKPLRQIILRDRGLADLAQCLNSMERDLCKPDSCSCVCLSLFLPSQSRGNILMSVGERLKEEADATGRRREGKKNKRKRVEESQ